MRCKSAGTVQEIGLHPDIRLLTRGRLKPLLGNDAFFVLSSSAEAGVGNADDAVVERQLQCCLHVTAESAVGSDGAEVMSREGWRWEAQ